MQVFFTNPKRGTVRHAYPVQKGRSALYITRNPSKQFLFLSPNSGLRLLPHELQWAMLAVPYLFTITFYWEQ